MTLITGRRFLQQVVWLPIEARNTNILRYCPKCKTFSDDGDLRFCLTDGVPLVDIDEDHKKWKEGVDAVNEARRVLKHRELRRGIKRFLSIVTTLFLTVMVISVITLNSWIYFGEPVEIAQNTDKFSDPGAGPSPTPTPQTVTEGGEPTVETETSPSPTPSPTITQTPGVEVPVTTPVLMGTPDNRTPTPTPTPDETAKCSADMRQRAEQKIEAEYSRTWREQFLRDKDMILNTQRPVILKLCETRFANSQACKLFVERTEITLGEAPIRKSVASDEKCTRVTATVTYQWKINMPQLPAVGHSQTKSFPYTFP